MSGSEVRCSSPELLTVGSGGYFGLVADAIPVVASICYTILFLMNSFPDELLHVSSWAKLLCVMSRFSEDTTDSSIVWLV